MNIFVGNMPYSMTENELASVFAPYGAVNAVRIILDRETKRPKGFAFVEMKDDAQAKAAIDAVNGTEQGGRTLVVNEARPREERPRRFSDRPRD